MSQDIFSQLDFFCKFKIFLFLINNKDFYQIMYLQNFKLSKIITEHKTICFYLNIYPCLSILHDLIDVNSSLLLFLNGEKSPLKYSQLIYELTLYFYKLCHFWLWWSTNIMISISESHKHSSWCSERHHVQVILKQLHIKRSVDNGKANGRCCGIIITNYSPNALHSTVR